MREESPLVIETGSAAEAPPSPFVVGAEPAAAPAEDTQVLEGMAPPSLVETEVEVYREDWIVAILAAILAAAPFLPWYKYTILQKSFSASGFETGTWGPVITFLGGLSLVLILLRRAFKVRIALPISEPHLHEAIGWISIACAVVKFRLVPSAPGAAGGRSFPGVYLAILVAFILAFVAGRMSGSAPLVSMPRWYKGRAGLIGTFLLLVAIGLAALFGAANNANLAARQQKLLSGGRGIPTGPQPSLQTIDGKFPKCRNGFPIPQKSKPIKAVESGPQNPNCVFTFSTGFAPKNIADFYDRTFKGLSWTFKRFPPRAGTYALQVSKPICATVSITPDPAKSNSSSVIVATSAQCQQQPSGGASQ